MDFRVIEEYVIDGCRITIREPIMTDTERLDADDTILRKLEHALKDDKYIAD